MSKGYEVHGLRRRTSSFNTWRIDPILDRLQLHYADVTDALSLVRVLSEVRPDEVYNLAAQSHVGVSFEVPGYTAHADALGCLSLLEAIRLLKLDCRFYQASSSEMFGNATAPQSEETPMAPVSPYGAAKLYAHHLVSQYRQGYGMWAVSGILFNHESERRGETFVSTKIVRHLVGVNKGTRKGRLKLGNIDARRDWGYAPEYVDGIYRMMQMDTPVDMVLATGESHSVGDFGLAVCRCLDLPTDETLEYDDPGYMRPIDINDLCGDASLAKRLIGWNPKAGLTELVARMVAHEMSL